MQGKPLVWTGRVISALVTLFFVTIAVVNLAFPEVLRPSAEVEGLPAAAHPTIGILALLCAVLYALGPTAALGAILVTGFLGGSMAIHLRIGHFASGPVLLALSVGVLAWAGLFLRDPRLRALLPLRARPAAGI